VLPRARRDHRALWAAAAIVTVVALVSWYLTQPAALVLIQQPIATNDTEVLDRAAVIGVEDRLGRKLRVTGVRVSVSGIPGQTLMGTRSVEMLAGEATFDSLIVGSANGQRSELNFAARGLRGVRWASQWDGGARLVLRSGQINGRVLSGAVPLLKVRPQEIGRASCRERV